MRAIIAFYSIPPTSLNQDYIAGFLKSEGWTVREIEDPDLRSHYPDTLKKINEYISQIATIDKMKVKTKYYIASEQADGLLGINEKANFEIRIYKYNIENLKYICESLVEGLIRSFNHNETKLSFENIKLRETIPSDNEYQSKNYLIGEIYYNRWKKLGKALEERSFEFWVGVLLMTGAFICIVISFMANAYCQFFTGIECNYEINKLNNNIEWQVNFAERLIAPLSVTGGVLLFNFAGYARKMLRSKSVVYWRAGKSPS